MYVLLEFLELKLSIDLNKFNNLMLGLNVDYLISEKSVMIIFHSLLNVKHQLHVQLF
jgi:hypothetical protein